MKETTKEVLKKAPLYCIIPVLALVVVHYVTYDLAMILVPAETEAYTLNTIIDELWPFQPIWIFVYLGDYIFNFILYFLMGFGTKKNFYTFAAATILIQVIAFFFFVFFPVEPPRQDLIGDDFLTNLVRENYATDLSYNCFPSLHCGLTVLVALGIVTVKKMPTWFKVFSVVFTVMVCLSTLFLDQHFFLDAVFGVALAVFLFWGCGKFGWYKPFMRFFEWINRNTWGRLLPDVEKTTEFD